MTTSTTTPTTPQTLARSASRTGLPWWAAALLGALVTATVNVTIWSVARLAGSPVALQDDGAPYPITVGSVAVMSVVPMIAGIALAALIARWWVRVLRVAQVVGSLLAVVTLWGAFSGDTGTGVTLTAMHLTSATVVVLALEAVRTRALTR